ncbi:MAG: HigA family addiction module antitoxin [Akkermansiaceae bacterium]|nr:HigA family addiction module antitoxin [Akkermansiaceae bacterium]
MTREQKAIIEAKPGRMLKEEFLDPNHLNQSELSRRTGIPRTTINEIIKGKRPINAETALVLGTFFGMDPRFWINLQSRYDLRVVQFEKEKAIRARVQPLIA